MNIRAWVAGLWGRSRSPEQLTAAFEHPVAAMIPPEFRRYLETYSVTNMRYPPYQEGYPGLISGEWFMRNHQRELYERIEGSVGLPHNEFKLYLEPVLVRFAELAHLLPASENHHHAGAGGLIRHSLEVASLTLDKCQTTAFDALDIPSRRSLRRFRWNVAAVIAGVLHDAGKPLTDITAMDHAGEHRWVYGTETIHEWSRRLNIQRYFLLWSPERHARHVENSVMLLGRMVPDVTMAWLMEGGEDIKQAMLEAVAGKGSSVLAEAVRWADGRSVEREMKRGTRAGTGGDTGVPVPRLVLDAMQRLLSDGRWLVNVPGARVWSTIEGIFIAWTQGAEDVVGLIAKDGMPIPRSPDTLAGVLKSHNIIEPAPDGEMFWLVTPHVLMKDGKGPALRCIKLTEADLLFTYTPIPPPVSVSLGKEGSKQALVAPNDVNTAPVASPDNDPLATLCGPLVSAAEQSSTTDAPPAAKQKPAKPQPATTERKPDSKPPQSSVAQQLAAASAGITLSLDSPPAVPETPDALPEEELEAFTLDEMLLGLTPHVPQLATESSSKPEPLPPEEGPAPIEDPSQSPDEPTIEMAPGEKISLDVLLGKRAPSKKAKAPAQPVAAAQEPAKPLKDQSPQAVADVASSGWDVPADVAEKLTRREIMLLRQQPALAQKLLHLDINEPSARYVYNKLFLAFRESAFVEGDIPNLMKAGWLWQDILAEDDGIVRTMQRRAGFVLAAEYSRILVKLICKTKQWPVPSPDDFTVGELDQFAPILSEIINAAPLDRSNAIPLKSLTPGSINKVAEAHGVDPARLEEALYALRDGVRSHVRKRIYIRPLPEELRQK